MDSREISRIYTYSTVSLIEYISIQGDDTEIVSDLWLSRYVRGTGLIGQEDR